MQDNGGNNLAVSASGSFTFSTAVAGGAAYSVSVLTQPTGQSCAVSNGSGTASANVSNVQVTCSQTAYTIGGTVLGLTGTGLILQDWGEDNLSVSANGSFTFSYFIGSGSAYKVTVLSQPTGQSCTVTNGSGTANAKVSNVEVTCTAAYYTIGGTVSGLTVVGLVLQDNGSNNLAVSASGTFTFSNSVASGSAYNVTVLTQPTGQSCTVTNGSGTANAKVSNVGVACVGAWTNIPFTGYQHGYYGTLGTAGSTNTPGAQDSAVSWSDESGNLWLFGGSGYDANAVYGDLNDLWKFDPNLGTKGEWTWMGGSSTVPTGCNIIQICGLSGVYGTPGTAAATNIPGGRNAAVSWSDASGNFWLFGGAGFDSTGTDVILNDLWKFDPKLGTNGEWAWMGGSSTSSQSGVYGALGMAASTNIPGGRYSAVSWSDTSGNLWLFGGDGLWFDRSGRIAKRPVEV